MKQNVVCFFGGKSSEHDISILTGIISMKNFDREKFEIYPVYIDMNNVWYTGEKLKNIETFKDKKNLKKTLKRVQIFNGDNALYWLKGKKIKQICQVDVALLCNHGLNGEDGTLCGQLELCNIPYSCCDNIASAIFMNKIITKKVLKGMANLVDYYDFDAETFFINSENILNSIEKKIGYPCIIKPAKLGSSIGIRAAHDKRGLIDAIGYAIQFDNEIIVEKFVPNCIEINCSVMKVDGKICVSQLDQPIASKDILSFCDKYLSKEKGNRGMQNAKKIFPAQIDVELEKTIKEISKKIYKALIKKGVVRMDFLIDENKKIYLNEVNTIPGSLSYYLWQDTMNFTELLSNIIDGAYKDFNAKQSQKYCYSNSGIFDYVGKK